MLTYFTALFSLLATSALCSEPLPYKPSKVVYDLSDADLDGVNHILDRVSMLQNVYANNSFEASIIIVIHEGAIPLFSKKGKKQNAVLVQRAYNLTLGEIIQFRLCAASARMQGFKKNNFRKFITIVPMADAEIVRLQNSGYAYLR